jgi:hypothetical protein
MQVQTQVGPVATTTSIGAGTVVAMRSGNLGDTIVSELHGRFYEQTYRGNVYSGVLSTITSISNATFTTADALSGTLGTAATATPILGLWNNSTNTVNAVILQASLAVTTTALTATGAGGFVWCAYAGNGAISTGTTPVNRKTLAASGSQCKALMGVALTGLTNTGVAIGASSLNGGPVYNVSEVATASGFHTQAVSYTENLDGSIIIPPGGVIGLFATTTPVALSAVSSIMWEEVPI